MNFIKQKCCCVFNRSRYFQFSIILCTRILSRLKKFHQFSDNFYHSTFFIKMILGKIYSSGSKRTFILRGTRDGKQHYINFAQLFIHQAFPEKIQQVLVAHS
jgi:hypothetical protein